MKKELVLVAVTIVLLIAAAIAACRQTAGLTTPSLGPGEAAATPTPGQTLPTTVAPGSTTAAARPALTPATPEGTVVILTPTSPPVTAGSELSAGAVSPTAGTGSRVPTAGPSPASPAVMSFQEWQRIAFKYISDKYRVPLDELSPGGFSDRRVFPLTNVAIASGSVMWNKGGFKGWEVAIDQNGKIYEADGIIALGEAERAAARAKYGKLWPSLYNLLQTKGPEDRVQVTLWVKGARPIDQVWADTVKRYPEARLHPQSRPGYPGPDTPRELFEKVVLPAFENEWKANVARATKPLVDYLTARGYPARADSGFPSVVATLPKKAILEVQQREDVATISGGEDDVKPTIDTAVPSIAAPAAWATGKDASGRPVSGEGVLLGIQEFGASVVDFRNPYLRGSVVGIGDTTSSHPTLVAGAAASNHPKFRGPAYKSTILSTRFMGENWRQASEALYDSGARLINHSYGKVQDGFQDRDMWIDYFTRNRGVVNVTTAGNEGASTTVSSPGKAYNVITVGSYDDRQNVIWSWDFMSTFSSWKNSTDKLNEKPDLVAPGQGIYSTTTQDDPGDVNPDDWIIDTPTWGTSLAAPQVAGGVAMLFQKDGRLVGKPEAVKAILMASAIHNITGDADMKRPDSSNESDLKDGAGGLDLAVAYDIVNAGWWEDKSAFPLRLDEDFDENGWYTKSSPTVELRKAERLRAAIAWHSFVNSESNPTLDELQTKLYLYLFRLPDETNEVSSSLSNTESSQLIDYYKTGGSDVDTYKIKIKKFSSTEDPPTNFLGLAWWKVNRYYAASSLEQEQRSSDLVILQRVRIDSFSEPRVASALGNEVAVPGGTLYYAAKATYPGWDPVYGQENSNYSSRHPIWVKDIERGSIPFIAFTEKSTHNDAYEAYTTFSYTADVSTTPVPFGVAGMGVLLDGSSTKPYQFYQYFETLTGSNAVPQENISTQTAAYWEFLRGDAKADGVVTIVDANWIAQYTSQLRPLSDLNAVNAASPRHDYPPLGTADYDRITIQDAMFIGQYLSGIRDNFYEMYGSSAAYQGVAAGQATVEAGAPQLSPNGSGRIPLMLKNITGIAGVGAYDIKVVYDPKVIKVTSVDGGVAPFDRVAAFKIDGNKGVVWLNAFHAQVPGLTKDGAVAYLNVSPVAAAGKSTNVQVTVTTLSDVVGNDISSRVVNGSVTIK